jgi:hypothetical protein
MKWLAAAAKKRLLDIRSLWAARSADLNRGSGREMAVFMIIV